MKNWGLTCLVLLIAVSVWGESETGKFRFVSTLSAPVASFGEVETKTTGLVTRVGYGTGNTSQVFVGSASSAAGTIEIKGKPACIEKLYMDKDSSITSDEELYINWLVKELEIYPHGAVTVDALIANEVKLDESYYKTTLTAQEEALVEKETYTRAGEVSNKLTSTWSGGGQFKFLTGEETPSNATWKTTVTVSDSSGGIYYPVTTAL